MDTAASPDGRDRSVPLEGEADRRRRIAWEAARIAEARAEVDAGLFVDAADVDAWLESLGTADERPAPPTRRR